MRALNHLKEQGPIGHTLTYAGVETGLEGSSRRRPDLSTRTTFASSNMSPLETCWKEPNTSFTK